MNEAQLLPGPSRTIRLLQVLSCAFAFAFASAAFAQNSQLVAVDDAGGFLPGGIGSLDLYDNGLYWTVYGGGCSGEFSTLSSLALMGFRNPPYPQERYLVNGCPAVAVGGATRNDTFAYYTTPAGVQRKPVGASTADAPARIGPDWAAFGSLIPGAMMTFNGSVYYAWSSATPVAPWGNLAIERFTAPGTGGNFQSITIVADGAGMGNLGRIKKMAVAYRRIQGVSGLFPHGLALTDAGYLLRFSVADSIVAGSKVVIAASGINDFAVRREQFFSGNIFELSYEQDAVWAVTRAGNCPTDAAARVITVDPVTGATTTIHTSLDGYLSAIALDSEYVFVSGYARQAGGGIFGCSLLGEGVIRSKRWPAALFVGGGVDPDWSAIEIGAGDNLRSDGQWLYFTREKQVRRVRNNTAAIQHDFSALGLEAVQVVQDLNNSVRLVEGKRTVVRAYARVANSTLAATDWFPAAQLRGWRNGVELPNSPIRALNRPVIRATGDYAVLRPDANRSFQFELPADWVRSGLLTLQFTVNPALATYESGASPLANNSVTAQNLTVVQVPKTCLTFATIHNLTSPNYWPWDNANDFARVMERARAMLPVADLHVHPTTERVSDEHVCLRTCSVLGIPVPCGFICNDPFDLATADGWSEALLELRLYDGFDQNRPGCGRTHYVGAIHPAVLDPAWGGLAPRPGTHLLSLMTPTPDTGINSAFGGVILAHELGHNLGRRHVNQTLTTAVGGCGADAPLRADMSYPNDGCAIAPNTPGNAATALGFDVVSFQPVAPTAAGDLMSYANNTWPSVWTYNAMLDALGPVGPSLNDDPPAPPAGPYLLVRGRVDLDLGEVTLKPCYTVEEGLASPEKVAESFEAAAATPASAYRIRTLDGNGSLIEETPLVIETHEDADPLDAMFHQYVTKPAGTSRVQILRNQQVVAESIASPNPPVINAVGAVYDETAGAILVEIDAFDADLDPLRFAVQFSHDAGLTWRTLRVNEGAFSFSADARFLPGGEICLIRVIASDGFNGAVGVSDAFAILTAAPEAFIGGVVEGQRLDYGTSESLLGFGLDAEDGGLPADSLTWDLQGPTPRQGTGPALSLQGLIPGSYEATLTVVDSAGNVGSSTLAFEILAFVVREGVAPVMDGEANDAAYAVSPALVWSPGTATAARLVHSGGNLHVAFTDLAYRGSGALAAVAGLRVDVNADGGTASLADDVGFFVTEEGQVYQMKGDGAVMVLNTSPSTGFKAVITRGPAGWNAELQIADNLLGGWNHGARLLLEHDYLLFDVPALTLIPSGAGRDNPSTWFDAWFGLTPPEPVNLPPVAQVFAPAILDLTGDTLVQLDGGASFDPEGGALTHAWTQLEGPPVVLENAASATPHFQYGETGAPVLFRFQLVVNDGVSDSAPATTSTLLQPVIEQSFELPPAVTPVDESDGSVEVSLIWPGGGGSRARVQASSNLNDWETIATAVAGPLSALQYRDLEAASYPRRFYRLSDAPATRVFTAGSALEFDGFDDVVDVPHDVALNAFPMSVSFWVRTTSTNYLATGLVNKYIDASANGWSMFLSDGRLRGWYFKTGTDYVFPSALGLDGGFIADDQWHHVVFTVDAAGGRFYVDAVERASAAWLGTPGPATGTRSVQFGRYNAYPAALEGRLDDIAIWSRALSPYEIADLREFGADGTEPDLLGLWRLDDGEGTTAIDASGNGRTGTLLNGPVWVPSDAPITAAP